MLFEPFTENINLVVVYKQDLGNLDVIADNIFVASGRLGTGSKEKTYTLRTQC